MNSRKQIYIGNIYDHTKFISYQIFIPLHDDMMANISGRE